MELRLATAADAEAIAALHADSWRRHYRGAYSDAFLDGDVAANRLAVWSERLRERSGHTVLAENGGELVGFVHTFPGNDPVWGALLDNLHVAHSDKRNGLGSQLLAASAESVDGTGLYLWVLEQNVDAQAFYAARGGERVERAPEQAPGGVPGRLAGEPWKLRYAWRDPSILAAVAQRQPPVSPA